MATAASGEADVVAFATADAFTVAVCPTGKAEQQQRSQERVHAVPLFPERVKGPDRHGFNCQATVSSLASRLNETSASIGWPRSQREN